MTTKTTEPEIRVLRKGTCPSLMGRSELTFEYGYHESSIMIRKTTSLTALLSFILLMLTSIIIHIVLAGRVAYRADYQLWGLSKT